MHFSTLAKVVTQWADTRVRIEHWPSPQERSQERKKLLQKVVDVEEGGQIEAGNMKK